MDKDLFEKALTMIDFSEQACKVSLFSWTLDFFTMYNIPIEVIEFIKEYSFNTTIKFKNISYYANVNNMVDINLEEVNGRCIAERLLIIGFGLNGDFVALNLNTSTVGYIFHDDLWENSDVNPMDIFINLDCTIGQFYYNSVTKEDFPVDGYEAERYLNNLHKS